jgi:hypothetical protein
MEQVRQASAGGQLMGGSLLIGGWPGLTQWRTCWASKLPGWRQQPSRLHQTTCNLWKLWDGPGHGTRLLEYLTANTKTFDATSTRTSMNRRSFYPSAHQMVSPFHLAKICSTNFTFSMFSRSKAQAGWPKALSMRALHMVVDNTHTSEHNKQNKTLKEIKFSTV